MHVLYNYLLFYYLYYKYIQQFYTKLIKFIKIVYLTLYNNENYNYNT